MSYASLIRSAEMNVSQLEGNQTAEKTLAGSSYATAQATIAIAHELRLANLINWYHAVPQPNPDGNTLRALIEKELDL